MKTKQTKRLAYLGMLIGIELVLLVTPLGYVPLGPIKATTMHLPVIIAVLTLGVKEGMILGSIFGLTSIVMNTFFPTPFSFCFSPFFTVGEISGSFASVIIAVIPRVMIACTTAWSAHLFSRMNKNLSIGLSALIGSMTNTILVLGGIYLFFGQQYALVRQVAYEALFGVLSFSLFTNGILEALLAVIVSLAIMKAFNKQRRSL